MTRRSLLGGTAAALAAVTLWRRGETPAVAATYPLSLPDAEWKKRLSPGAYDVLRHEGTERPGTSPLLNEHRGGTFVCAGCQHPVYSSATKFDSGTGWPSFWAALPGRVQTKTDTSLFMTRVEEHCANCGGHLGHVFDDGPKPTGKRHCINGVALNFRPEGHAHA